MKKDLVQLSIAFFALVFGGALEELLPKFAGAGFPVLLMSVVYVASRRSVATVFLFAIAAGAMEDALSALPFATSLAYFVLVAAFVKATGLVESAFAFSFPVYQLWLRMWSANLNGGVFGRFLVSIPLGLATAVAVWAVLRLVERKGAVDAA